MFELWQDGKLVIYSIEVGHKDHMSNIFSYISTIFLTIFSEAIKFLKYEFGHFMQLNFSNGIKSFRWDQRAKLKYIETSLGKYGCKCPGKRKDKLQSSACLHII